MRRPLHPQHLCSLVLATLAGGVPGAAHAESDDDGLEARHLWPLVESTHQPEGRHFNMLLFYLFHRTSNPDGSTYSWNVLTYLQSPTFSACLPLYYRWGPEQEKRTLVAPVWLAGPGFAASPLLCSGGWTRADGGHALWITPLFHENRRADGTLEDRHVLTWFEGEGWRAALPLFFQTTTPGDEHTALLPLYVSGPGWWTVPPALTGWWRHDDGGSSLWITPLIHGHVTADGALDRWHVLDLYHDADRTLLFPIAWWGGSAGHRNLGILPLLIKQDRAWFSPLALSATWPNAAGGRTSWLTPLAHVESDRSGRITRAHLMNYIHAGDLDSVLPLAWWWGEAGSSSGTVLPAVFWGPDWWLAPLALSGGARQADGSATLWVTPLFHRSHDAAGSASSWHALTLFASRSGGGADAQGTVQPAVAAWGALPFYYHRQWSAAQGSQGALDAVLPLWVKGPTFLVTALTARWDDAAGNTTSWVTPLMHRSLRRDGSISSMHLLSVIHGSQRGPADAQGNPSGSAYDLVLPFFYRYRRSEHGASETYQGVPLVWMQGPETTVVPPLLSVYRQRAGEGSSLWATPLFHWDSRQDGTFASMHAGPLALWGPPAARSFGIFPLWFQDPDSWVCPPALSLHVQRADGSRSTWITPLVHIASDHAGTSLSITPLYYDSPGRWVSPLALSAHWTRSDGGSSTWLTPLVHVDRSAAGDATCYHVLNYVHGPDGDLVLPLAWRSGEPGARSYGLLPLWLSTPDWWLSPPLLTGWRRRDDGGGSLWITPFFHRGSDAAGATTDWHALTVIHHGDTDMLLPLAWRTGPPDARTSVILPFFVTGPGYTLVAPIFSSRQRSDGSGSDVMVFPVAVAGPDYWVAPLLLSGQVRQKSGRTTTVVTPLYHRTTQDGALRHMHLLTYIATPDLRTAFPLWWDWRTNAARHRLALPIYYQRNGADGEVTGIALPGLFSYHAGRDLDTSFAYQLIPFLVQDTDQGHEVNVLWRLFHRRALASTTEVEVAPLWWSEHHQDAPASWQVLGGLLARSCNYQAGTSRYSILWGMIPLGGRQHFAPAASGPAAADSTLQ